MRNVPRPHVPTPDNVLPTGGQSWGSYWTIVTAMVLVMFVIFLAANGQLAKWLTLFTYAPAATVQPAGAGDATSGTVPAPIDHSQDTVADKMIDAGRGFFGALGQFDHWTSQFMPNFGIGTAPKTGN